MKCLLYNVDLSPNANHYLSSYCRQISCLAIYFTIFVSMDIFVAIYIHRIRTELCQNNVQYVHSDISKRFIFANFSCENCKNAKINWFAVCCVRKYGFSFIYLKFKVFISFCRCAVSSSESPKLTFLKTVPCNMFQKQVLKPQLKIDACITYGKPKEYQKKTTWIQSNSKIV